MKNNYRDRVKVLSTLSMAATDAREDTLSSVIISTLNELDTIEFGQIGEYIEETFGFKPYKEEVDLLINKLNKEGKILKENGNLSLSIQEKSEIANAEIILRDKDKARFNNFKNFLIDEGFDNLDNRQINKLWSAFIEYLYNNFFDYGEDALKRLHPNIIYNKKFEKDEDYLQVAYKKLQDKDLNIAFKIAVDKFADYASQDDIDFLNDLAQKTLSFTSLGIDPKLSETALDISLVDWVLYLDTNVLYSILNLHSHPENEATKALINLINENKLHLNVILRYSELTKKELRAKKDDFILLDEKLSDSSIRAAIKTGNLDDFSKQFYEGLLSDRDSTLHPSKVIELSNTILVKREIDVARNSKHIEHLGEEYLNEKIQEYRRYINQKNDYKEDFYKSKGMVFHPIFKSDKQITHDITLRELLISLRTLIKKKKDLKELDFNSVKYFGLTLDSLLINYDSYQIGKFEDERSFPVFFRPSYLLNRLVRILPIQTTDYKKAFLKAVTSKGFNKDAKKSRDVLKILNYLKTQGIDDETVVYNLISKDLFIQKYNQINEKSDEKIGEFFESELNKQFKIKLEELESVKVELKEKALKASKVTEKNEKLETKKSQLETDLDVYKNSIIKLKSDFRKLEKNLDKTPSQIPINFEAEESKKELETSQKRLTETQSELLLQYKKEAKNYQRKELVKWQKRIWWHLLWVIPITVFILYIILFPKIFFDQEIDTVSIRVLLSLFLVLIDGLFIALVKIRYWDEGNKLKKRDDIDLPSELQSKIDSINNGR